MGGTLHTTLFSLVYTAACECIFSLQLERYSNIHSRSALREAGPKKGGFQCALDKESADALFYKLTLDESVVWVKTGE